MIQVRKELSNDKVTVSFLGWSGRASWRRYPLKKEEELTGDKEDEQIHEVGARPYHLLKAEGMAAGAKYRGRTAPPLGEAALT